jgi:hypothetical protein
MKSAFYHHFRNYGCRLNTDLFYNNIRVAVLENELLRISLLIDKGTDIFEFLYKPKDMDFLWLSPWGIKSPSTFIPTISSKEGNFLDYYEGGWQEIIPNFGKSGFYNGVEQGLHGEVCLIPWDYQIIKNTPEEISIRFSVRTYRTPFYIEKTLTLKSGDPKLYIHEKITNEGYSRIYLNWTHHPTFGGNFLDNSTVIDIPSNRIKFVLTPDNEGKYDEIKSEKIKWPVFKGYSGNKVDFSKSPTAVEKNNSFDEICIGDLKDGWYAVTNISNSVGFAMKWDSNIFPYLWIWRMYGKGCLDAPWFGRAYCMAIEPCSSMSPIGLNETIKNKTAIKMEAQQQIETSLVAIAYEKSERVRDITKSYKII